MRSPVHELTRETLLHRSLGEVFAFFSSAENLERITPPELNFQILTDPPGPLTRGAVLDYRLRLFGLPFKWRTRIDVWDPPHEFTDTQISGPYRRWEHTHTFEEVGGGTLVADRVVYQLPFPPAGELAHPLVRRQLERIFDYRRDRIQTLLSPNADASDR